MPDIVTIQLGSKLSVHVAPGSTRDDHNVRVTLFGPDNITTGAISSTTFTILVTIFDGLPTASVYRYCNTYVHVVLASTIPLFGVFINPFPSTLSTRLAPGSVHGVSTV